MRLKARTFIIFVRLVTQHCCTASWKGCCPYYYRVLNSSCNKFQSYKLQQIVAQTRKEFYFLQQTFSTTCNTGICYLTSWAHGSYTGNNTRKWKVTCHELKLILRFTLCSAQNLFSWIKCYKQCDWLRSCTWRQCPYFPPPLLMKFPAI